MTKKYLLIIFSMIFIFLIYIFFNFKVDITNNTFISYGNSEAVCNIKSTKLNEEEIIKKYNSYDFVKLDKVYDVQEITYNELKSMIAFTKENNFKYGLALFNNRIVILSEEITAHQIIDYASNSINYDNLNNFLKSKKIYYKINKIDKLSIFLTESKLLENDNFVNLEWDNGFKRKNNIKNNLDDVIKNAGNLLKSMNLENGKFIYGINANSGKTIDSYNVLRHAGSVWSLILYYNENPNEDLKKVIINSIDYLLDNFLINYSDDIIFVIDKSSNDIKLGGNGLTLLMLAEYAKTFNDNSYNDIARKIANGIIYLQEEDGSYIDVLDSNFNLKEKDTTVYYDGEATFGLLKFYDVDNNKKYFEHAKGAIDFFIDNNYEKYRDQWISYTMVEFLKNNLDERYIEFTFKNYTFNIDNIDKYSSFGPTRLEFLMNIYKAYNYILENKNNSELLQQFNLEQLKNSIEININILLKYYIDKEVAMYFDKPKLSLFGFSDYKDNFRMRIDDIQHSLSGLIAYKNMLFND